MLSPESVGGEAIGGMLRGVEAIRYENLLINILSNLGDDALLPFPGFLLNFCQRDCDWDSNCVNFRDEIEVYHACMYYNDSENILPFLLRLLFGILENFLLQKF